VISFQDPTILKDINEHSYYDVASYILFSDKDFRRVFPTRAFGIYEKEFEMTKKFSIMVRN